MLSGKTCIVTGSTAGIGKGIARSFLQQGAFVYINGRSENTVNTTLRSFSDEGLTNAAGIVRRTIPTVSREFLDIYLSVAGWSSNIFA